MGASDDEEKVSGLPSWQRKPAEASPAVDMNEHSQPSDTSARKSLLDKARKFLSEEDVRDASTEKKIEFLENKGLTNDEIHSLLGISRNTSASNSIPSPSGTSHEASVSTSPSPIPASSPPARDMPPVITYPEFLTTPAQASPFITAQRLLSVLYIFGGLSTLLYGTTTHVVSPMVASLTASRRELAESAQANLDRFVTKLEGSVSRIPQQPSEPPLYRDDEDDESDPTEMFHRDIGVQTSLPASRSSSRAASPSPLDALEAQRARLFDLTSHIRELNEACESEAQDSEQFGTNFNVLRDYLNDLLNVTPSFNFNRSYGGHDKNQENDGISKFKAEIRGLKGGLLSAKSFPSPASRSR
ncbi:MAG: hypothetical protein M1818_005830 [Claussenomyces sp. TS43310]|nr:MAG: hypothetical protein M1818_005830 [Claussenomyces sp. TS43310]